MLQIIKKHQPLLFIILATFFSMTSQAGLNPYNKEKIIDFGADTVWLVNKLGATKTGIYKNKGDNYYYHLSINDQRLLLQPNSSDASGNQLITQASDELEILDIIIDDYRLSRFQWCLDNQLNPASPDRLIMNAAVKNNVCTLNNDLIVQLDKESTATIKHAKNLTIIIQSGKYTFYLNYSMEGFLPVFNAYNEINASPVTPQRTEKKQPIIVEPIAKIVKYCSVIAPTEFPTIKAISYPCNNKSLQNKAQKHMTEIIDLEKHKQKAEQQRLKQQETKRQADLEKKLLEAAKIKKQLEAKNYDISWEQLETKKWINRCKKYWIKGTSPCICKPYISHAPEGTKDTCNN